MTDPEISVSADLTAKKTHPSINSATNKRWTNASGAWLGIGTSPGALLLGKNTTNAALVLIIHWRNQ